jgi:diguanylate cyclase (GGDEF)-like protein
VTLKLVRRAYALTAGVLILAPYVVPSVRPVAVGGIGVLSAAAITFGLARLRPQRWGAWLMIASAVLLLTVGDVVFIALQAHTPGQVPYPAASDAFYVAFYLPMTVGLLWLGRPRLRSGDWAMILDISALSLAGSLVVWVTIAQPLLTSVHLTAVGKVAAIASWVGYVAVLAASAHLFMAWRLNPALALLGAGLIAYLVSDYVYARQSVHQSWRLGTAVDLGYFAFSALCGVAALTPSMSRIASAGFDRNQPGSGRLATLAVALLAAPTALLVQVASGRVATGVAIAVVSAAVGLIVLARLSLTVTAYRRRGDRAQAIRTASRTLLLATTEGQVLAGIGKALTTMLPASATGAVRLIERDEGDPGESTPSTEDEHCAVEPGESGRGELRVPVRGEATAPADALGSMVFTAPVTQLLELAPTLQALADQAGSVLDRIRLTARVQVEERDRYFRTLVMTATDVILISRQGRIVYATPSALSMFGRDITGEKLDDLVHHHPPGHEGHDQLDAMWWDAKDGAEGYVYQPDGGALAVLLHRRDLTQDPTVNGTVTTLREVTAERNLQRDLAYRASHDALTGLLNAHAFLEALRMDSTPDTGRRSIPDGGRAALFLDLDDFKAVNDTFGHETGDSLLATVAKRIESCLSNDDLAARLGGDEFAVLLRAVPDVTAARAVAQRVVDVLAVPANVNRITVDCQASIGLAFAGERGRAESLLHEADTALYTAKAHGKGRWCQYGDEMPAPTRHYVDARRQIEDAIDADLLRLHYQPIIELGSGRTVGFEALIRLEPSGDTPMSPRELIMAAEATGLISTIGDWVLGQALADAVKLNPPGTGTARYVSVNVSARQLRQPDFADLVRAKTAATGADPSLLVLEITENFFLSNGDRAWEFLADLRRDGTRVAIDDFGTGYASLSYLRHPGIDIVKIDQSFLIDVPARRSRALLRAVTDLCAELELDEIAEGVQDAASRDLLMEVGCRYGQGFLYAHAMPIDEAIAWIAGD